MWMEGPCSMMVVEEDEGLRATWDQHAAETSLATECQPVSDEWVNGGGGVGWADGPLSGYPTRETTRHFHSHKPEQRLN